jgi:hypothetical protein
MLLNSRELAHVDDADSEDFDNQANANAANLDALDYDDRKEDASGKPDKARFDNPNAHLQELDIDNENERLLLKQEEDIRANVPQIDNPNEGIIADEIEEKRVEHEKRATIIAMEISKFEEEKARRAQNKKNQAAAKRDEAIRAINQQDKIEMLSKKKTIYYKIPYCSIVFNGLLLVSLFGVTLWQSFAYMQNLNMVMPFHLKLGKRIPNVQYMLDLARDTILNGVYKTYDNTELLTKYMTAVEDLDDSIESNLKQSFPSQFDNFKNIFTTFSLKNLCEGYKNSSGLDLVPDGRSI